MAKMTAHTGPRFGQGRLFALCAALIVLAMLWTSFTQGRKIDKQREFCAQYGAVYDGSGCIIPTADF